jgi:hypothetical protein
MSENSPTYADYASAKAFRGAPLTGGDYPEADGPYEAGVTSIDMALEEVSGTTAPSYWDVAAGVEDIADNLAIVARGAHRSVAAKTFGYLRGRRLRLKLLCSDQGISTVEAQTAYGPTVTIGTVKLDQSAPLHPITDQAGLTIYDSSDTFFSAICDVVGSGTFYAATCDYVPLGDVVISAQTDVGSGASDVLEVLRSPDWDISRQIVDVKTSSFLPYRQTLANRLEELRVGWFDEGEEWTNDSAESLHGLLGFLEVHRYLPRPTITITPAGTFRAEWTNNPNEHLAINFLPNGEARFVIFAPNARRPHQIKRLSGMTRWDSLSEDLAPYLSRWSVGGGR